ISSETPIMLGGDFPKRRARCTTARSSAARSTARPRLTRPRSCMRKESSFTRCPCCRTSGTDQRPTSTWSWAMHHLRFFDARIYPADIPPQERRGLHIQKAQESDLYKSVNRRYAAEEFALQLRALCSDHPVDGPSFDQFALRVALSFGRVVADDEPAGQVGRRTEHSRVRRVHRI